MGYKSENGLYEMVECNQSATCAMMKVRNTRTGKQSTYRAKVNDSGQYVTTEDSQIHKTFPNYVRYETNAYFQRKLNMLRGLNGR